MTSAYYEKIANTRNIFRVFFLHDGKEGAEGGSKNLE